MSQSIPITLLTGYLGSGKTTLLRALLAHPQLRNTAVLVNEFGEIALDHQLLYSSSETVVLLDRGCLCCALRSDLADQLDDLYTRRMRKEVPAFDRVVIETTGLADPGPILQTLVAEPMLAALYRLEAVVTTVDGELGLHTLDEHFESVKQAAVADCLVVTKADRATAAGLAELEARLGALNPAAPILRCVNGDVDPNQVLGEAPDGTKARSDQAARWLRATSYQAVAPGTSFVPSASKRHDDRIRSFALIYDAPVSGARLWQGLEALIERHGEKLLRIKGIVNVEGISEPKVIHIVQHVLYPVQTLEQWPDADRRTRLVFIVRDLDPSVVRATIDGALGHSNPDHG